MVQNNPSFLVSFSLLFDLIKIVVIYSLCGFVAHLLLYISWLLYTSWRTHYLSFMVAYPLPSLQADSISLLPTQEINERKQTIIRELQLFVTLISVLKTFLFCFLDSSQMGTKSEQRKLREVLCLRALRHASRTRRVKENIEDKCQLCVCVCVSKISETTKYKALKKAKKSKFLCCAIVVWYVIANSFTAAKVRHLFRIDKGKPEKYTN